MSKDLWKLTTPLAELDEHLSNAYKRIEGIVGFKLGQDRINLDALSSSAREIVNTHLYPEEPFFMRVGRSISTAASYRPKNELSLKELAAEILSEFYNEGTGAYQAVKSRLYDEAGSWLKSRGVDDERRRAALKAAEDSFLPPAKEDMTRQALPHVKQIATPGTLSCIGIFVGLALGIAAMKHPVAGGISGLICGALTYYLARKHLRTKAGALMIKLPQDLYSLLRLNLISNQTRYEEIVNNAAERQRSL